MSTCTPFPNWINLSIMSKFSQLFFCHFLTKVHFVKYLSCFMHANLITLQFLNVLSHYSFLIRQK